NLRFGKSEAVATTIETTVEANKNNTLFDFIKMSPNQTNPYTFDTTNKPLIYTTVELTTGKKETGGQAMRIYHNWSHVSNVDARQRVEGLFAAGADATGSAGVTAEHIPSIPQVAVLGMTNVPRPAIIDMAYAGIINETPHTEAGCYDRSAVMPEINFKMNISKLPPNPMTSVGVAQAADNWSSHNVSCTGDANGNPVGRILGRSDTPDYGDAYANLAYDKAGTSPTVIPLTYIGGRAGYGPSNVGSGDSRIYTYQRGIVCVLATREPESEEKTLDEYLLGLYDDNETFGGIQMFSYANPDPGDGSYARDGMTHSGATERLPTAPGGGPWNTGAHSTLTNVDVPSIWIKPIPIVPNVDSNVYGGAGTAQTPILECDDTNATLANQGGLMLCDYKNEALGLFRKKLVFHESPGYWLDSKVSSSTGAEYFNTSGAGWKWST
ncbi:MAG: hypothetical protein QF704_12895, partial [Anaerolineales bacterium]|nr:hypothetical protein [Anaerolineales bacterium]